MLFSGPLPTSIVLLLALVVSIQFWDTALGQDVEEFNDQPDSARVGHVDRFLGGAFGSMEQDELHQRSGGPDINRHCTKSDKFHGCCQQIGMTSTMTNIQQLIAAGCQYPPAELSIPQKMTLGSYFNQYVMCYADGQDNSQCCANAGVPSKVTKGLWSANCQNLCRGNNPTLTANAAWDKCSPYKPQIYACNAHAANLYTDSAAVQRGFCKNPNWCQRPMQWVTACSRHGPQQQRSDFDEY